MFNLAGYRLLFYYLQQQSDQQLEVALDKEAYNEQDLITIKLPLSLPYITDTKEFERVDGEVKVDGTIYKYVKRKIEHGVLVLLCLPDNNRTKLETAKDDFIKQATNFEKNTPVKKGSSADLSSFKTLLAQYDKPVDNWTSPLLVIKLNSHFTPYQFSAGTSVINSLEHPPEIVKA